MSKKTPKQPSRFSEYSPEHRHNVLLEEMSKKFDHFGEGLTDVQGKAAVMSQQLHQLKEDMAVVKPAVQQFGKDITAMKSDIGTIKSTFATKKDIEDLSKRLIAVESR